MVNSTPIKQKTLQIDPVELDQSPVDTSLLRVMQPSVLLFVYLGDKTGVICSSLTFDNGPAHHSQYTVYPH